MKASSPIAFFVTIAIMFAAFIWSMLNAHILISSYELGIHHYTPSQSVLSKWEHLHNCNHVDSDRPTIVCPLGKYTPPEYHQAMLSSYNNVINTKLFRECADLVLPLTPKDPLECWPRLIILPSHATSGNELFQYLMDRVFSDLDISMSQYHEYPSRKDPLFSISDKALDLWKAINATASNYVFSGIWGTRNTTAAIPFMQRPVIFKSHASQSDNATRRSEVAAPLIEIEKKGFLHGIIRMARNPGDQLLRNSFRWLSKKCYKDGDDCFFKNAHICCDDLVEDATTYRSFHSFWNEIKLDSPEMIVHYERITSESKVSGTIQTVLQFLNEIAPVGYYMKPNDVEMLKRVRDIIREPKYTHGTLVSQICGIEVAKMVHNATKEYSISLGYDFDDSNGYWTLRDAHLL